MRFAILIVAVVLAGSINALGQTTQPSATGPTAEQKMQKLLAPQPNSGQPLAPANSSTPTTDKSTGAAAVAPGAPNLPVIREGTHLTDASGRLSHSPDGAQAIFTFDSDGTTMQDPPMIIQPNLKLQGMESAVQSKASDVHFRVSGTVSEYKGRNYILLDKAVVMADVEKTF